jgi:squalene-hopene/tetraprenyl-beta-curcumene cyclase
MQLPRQLIAISDTDYNPCRRGIHVESLVRVSVAQTQGDRMRLHSAVAGVALVLSFAIVSFAEEPFGYSASELAEARGKAIEFLKTTQAEDGSWSVATNPGISGLVAFGLLRSGVSPDDPAMVKALEHLKTFVQSDGGIYFGRSDHKNYETCIALLAFHAANKDGRYDKLLTDAGAFLKELQWDEGEMAEKNDPRFGGAGYGRSQRPDLSNTSFLLDAFKALELPEDDPAMKNALIFVSRCQNLESEHNVTEFASKVNDGGFYYTPAGGGASMAGTNPDGGLRSYGSMTYAGFKSMIYAGLKPDDPRVKAAFEWIQRHYTLAENPGMGQSGLYYYFHTFAKAFDALKTDEVVDARGEKHNWRRELGRELLRLQQPNGSWVNPDRRWLEGDPNLSTAYALLSLAYCETPADGKSEETAR